MPPSGSRRREASGSPDARRRRSASARERRRNTLLERYPRRHGARQSHGDRAPGLQPGDRHAERRAGDVVEPDLVEEVDGVGVAAVLAADAELEAGPARAALLGGDPDQLADAVAVERLERADAEDALLQVGREERRLDVVAGEAPGGLGQVVGAEGEELGGLGDLRRRSARRAAARSSCRRGTPGARRVSAAPRRAPGMMSSLTVSSSWTLRDQRDHDLDARHAAGLDPLGRGLGDRARPASRTGRGSTRPRRTPRRPSIGFCSCSLCTACSIRRSSSRFSPRASATATRTDELGEVGQELVQRRVEQPDGDRQAVHRLEDADEVLALQRQQLRQFGLAGSSSVSARISRSTSCAALAEEHVLGAAQADALRAEPAGPRGVLGVVGVGPHRHPPRAVGVAS